MAPVIGALRDQPQCVHCRLQIHQAAPPAAEPSTEELPRQAQVQSLGSAVQDFGQGRRPPGLPLQYVQGAGCGMPQRGMPPQYGGPGGAASPGFNGPRHGPYGELCP